MPTFGARMDASMRFNRMAQERAQAREDAEAIRQEGIERRNELNQMLSEAYEPGYELPNELVGPRTEGGMNMEQAYENMMQGGRGMEAIKMQQLMRNKKLEEIDRQGEINRQAMQQFSGGQGLTPGRSMKITPRGPEFTIDPAKAATTRLAQEKASYERGGALPNGDTPSGGVSPRMYSTLPPKMQNELQKQRGQESIKGSQGRLNKLRETSASRQSSIRKATKFLNLFKEGKMKSGAGRKGAGWIPGVYTEQGQLDEEFNAFAEIAARQALKASGEIRPTDADVKGMKEAMFGIGRDEATNIQLLQDYLAQQGQDESDYQSLKGNGMEKARDLAGIDETGQVVPKIGDIVTGPDNNKYRVRSLKADGTPDDVEPVQ